MKESAEDLPATFSKPDLAARLESRLEEVGDSVATRERLQTMDFANSITRLVAELSEDYQPELPFELVLLGYDGRELQSGVVWSRCGRSRQVSTRAAPTCDKRGTVSSGLSSSVERSTTRAASGTLLFNSKAPRRQPISSSRPKRNWTRWSG